MVWDYAEANPFSHSTSHRARAIEWVSECLDTFPRAPLPGHVQQLDATTLRESSLEWLFSTDPPYYDNVGYADLADFFYVWLRRCLGAIYSDLFATLLTPKGEELIASPYRHGGDKHQAQRFFEEGLRKAFANLRAVQDHAYPATVFYAFKQAEVDADAAGGRAGRHPPRVPHRAQGRAARRPAHAPARQHRAGRPGPGGDRAGMAVFSRYRQVLEADGQPLRVRTALQLITQTLDEVLAEQEAEFDADTRWAVAWFEQHGMSEGPFGDAETLSKAKNTSVSGLVEAGILAAGGGKVQLLRREELGGPPTSGGATVLACPALAVTRPRPPAAATSLAAAPGRLGCGAACASRP